MFVSASAFNQPLNAWDVSRVTDFESMFYQAVKFNQPLSSWNVANGKNFRTFFYKATSFNQSLKEWKVRKDTSPEVFTNFLAGAISYQQVETLPFLFTPVTTRSTLDNLVAQHKAGLWATSDDRVHYGMKMSSWEVSRITDFSGLFYRYSTFNEPIGSWDVSNGVNFVSLDMIATLLLQRDGCLTLALFLSLYLSLSLSLFQCMPQNDIFNGAYSFNANIAKWNVQKATAMHDM